MIDYLRGLNLSTKILAVTIVVLISVVGVNYGVVTVRYQEAAYQSMVEKAAAFTAVADAAKNHTSLLTEQGSFDQERLRAELRAALASGSSYRDSKAFNTIPVVAGWKAAEAAAEREGITFGIRAFDARNPENEPESGSFEATLLKDLRSSYAGGGQSIDRYNAETHTLHYLRAIALTADCLACHGDPSDSLTGDGKDPLGFAMEGWSEGQMHGAYHVVMPMEPVDRQVASFISNGVLISLPLVMVASLVLLLMMRYTFARPVGALVTCLEDIADGSGDLSQRVEDHRQDELGKLGKAFNHFVAKVHDLVASVQGATQEVAAASTEIAASSDHISRGLDDQQKQTATISASAEEMSVSVSEVSRRALEGQEKARNAGQKASEGGEVVQQTIADMEAIAEAVQATASSIEDLGQRSEQIGAIIGVINDIADQTNLLALNAAIEAARAGEHGRGFAVVADEVRKLADRTTKATREVSDSIQAMQSGTEHAVERMESSRDRVTTGVERAGRAGASLESIVAGSQQVSSLAESIALASQEQSTAAHDVTQSVTSMSSVIKESAEGSRQASQAVTQLSMKAEQLAALIVRYNLNAVDRRSDSNPVSSDIREQRLDVLERSRALIQHVGLDEAEVLSKGRGSSSEG
ncbi:methyl-accepting chemotaxis protein [Mucisphaera calidilacus]|uniref:Methyl-accepting chemotaxis protein PctC n=1 Tax=Mucisphaera calidilacus TaxID=2527982 RepID=A0A518BZ85_9BACT|nr:methyl-accepting chemotaxis protein [Mucisphaera calidilacus]QDU72275.1 Methyl-accepting chemotaxis protein PctC [Mucisphaera calidilacus]